MDHLALIERSVCEVFALHRFELRSSRSERVNVADAKRVWAMLLNEEGVSITEIASICHVTRSSIYDRIAAFNIRILSDAGFKRRYLLCVSMVTEHEFESI